MNDTPPDLAIFGQPPREVTQALRKSLVLGGGAVAWLGPLFCIIGLLSTTIIAFIFTLDDAIPHEWEPAGEATIVAIERTGTHANNRSVYAYHFRGEIEGTSYGFYERRHHDEVVYEVNDIVPLERSRDRFGNNRFRLAKLYLTSLGPVGPVFFFLFFGLYGGAFAAIGLAIIVYGIASGQRIVRLLRYGETALARQTGVRKTLVHVNNRPVLKATLRYEVDGEEYTTYASSIYAERLNAETHVVFYDCNSPSRGVAWSGLPPITIEKDEWRDNVVRLTTTQWRAAMPTIAMLVMTGAFAALAAVVARSL